MKRPETILAAAALGLGAVASVAGAQAANPRNLPPAEYRELANSLHEGQEFLYRLVKALAGGG